VLAVVFAAMDLEGLDTFINDINLPPGSVLATADARGSIISRRPDPERYFGTRLSPGHAGGDATAGQRAVTIRGEDGVERLHTFARVGAPALTDYTVTIGIPTDTITSAARHDQLMSLLGLAATTMLALLAAWLVGDVLIVQRVRKLMGTAERIAAGDLDARSGIDYAHEEIGNLAQALDRMAAALQKKETARSLAERELRAADQRKDEFLAMLAHELRNPLAPISTGAHLLKLLHSDNAQITQTCSIIVRQVDHMTSLVDDLLDVSRVTRGLVSLSTQVLDLKRVVDDAVEQIRPLITARRHRVVIDLPPSPAHVKGDHKRLVQVVANLLNNATKYTPEGGTLELRLDADGEDYVLSVLDDGIGMEAGLVDACSTCSPRPSARRTARRAAWDWAWRWSRAWSSCTAARAGAAARAWARARPSRCACRATPRTWRRRRSRRRTPAADGAAPLRILLVDDNVDAVHTLQLFLHSAGHEVEVAYSATDALELAKTFLPEVCLLDIGLPDFDGNELARRLRQLPQTSRRDPDRDDRLRPPAGPRRLDGGRLRPLPGQAGQHDPAVGHPGGLGRLQDFGNIGRRAWRARCAAGAGIAAAAGVTTRAGRRTIPCAAIRRADRRAAAIRTAVRRRFASRRGSRGAGIDGADRADRGQRRHAVEGRRQADARGFRLRLGGRARQAGIVRESHQLVRLATGGLLQAEGDVADAVGGRRVLG
jgi:signal transduction histidine kinase